MADPLNLAPVATQHKDYARIAAKWRRARDVCAGTDAIHAAGVRYLPKLKEQKTEDYDAYRLRTVFYNASWRTVAGLEGMLFRKPPVVAAPEAVMPLFDDVTLGGVSLHAFAQCVAEECLIIGRVGIMADYPAGDTAQTQAEALRLNLRPTLALYKAESIINWRQRRIANRHMLTLVVLTEQYCETTPDGFGEKEETRYRVLDLDDGGNYRQRVFRIDEKAGQQQVGADVYPLMSGKPLTFIPFQFCGTDDTTPEVDDPPLIDLFDMNLAHYRNSADLEHGAHYTGLPQAVVTGYTKQESSETFYIGGPSAWVFPDVGAKAMYLEFTGQGLGTLVAMLEAKEQRMAVLGARMLEALKKGVESAETAGIHRVGEQSMLAATAQTMSIALTTAMQWFVAWAGAKGDASIDLNRDYFPAAMTPDQLTALVKAWQQGAISFDTLFWNLKGGEIVATDATVEDERAAIDSAPPLLLAVPPIGTPMPGALPAAA
jgi:Domain of unknown function (DUF4055)